MKSKVARLIGVDMDPRVGRNPLLHAGVVGDGGRLPFADQKLTVQHYRIDESHSNAYAEWVRQGKPTYPPPGQLAAIKARDGLELLHAPQEVMVSEGKVTLQFAMPVHSISLLVVTPAA